MGQAVLLGLQPLPFSRVLELGGLQIREQLLLPLALLLQLLPVAAGLLELLSSGTPGAVGLRCRSEETLQRITGKSIQPTPLLTRPRELLGLTLHGEIEQKGAQLLDLGAIDCHTIEPVAAAKALVAQTPLPRKQDLAVFSVELLLFEPTVQWRRQAEARLDHAPLAPLAQQARAPGSTQERIKRIQED